MELYGEGERSSRKVVAIFAIKDKKYLRVSSCCYLPSILFFSLKTKIFKRKLFALIQKLFIRYTFPPKK